MKRAIPFSLSFLFLSVLLFSSLGFASEGVFSLSFDPDDLVFEKMRSYDRVELSDGRLQGEPGTPLLPVRFIQIAIPSELEVVGVEVISSESLELPGTYRIYPAQSFYSLSNSPGREEPELVEPDAAVYGLSSHYPGTLVEVTNNGFLGGQHIAGIALHPLQYVPGEGKLVLYTRIQFKLIFAPTSRFPAPVNRRSAEGVRFYSDRARSLVINPEDVQLDVNGFLPPDEEVDYLIITDSSFVAAFRALADWKTRKGISTEIVDLSSVYANYTGADAQERIRNCVKDFYANRGTKWVLLGGDTSILPERRAIDIPSDLYYSDLDGDWNALPNWWYGELEDDVDMYADVFVGRAPSSDASQAQIFVDKCLTYETGLSTDYQNKILYAAEILAINTDGARLKEYIDSAFVPPCSQTNKLYEIWGNLNASTFRDAIEEGQNLINHAGHGLYGNLSIGPYLWSKSNMDSLTNGPRYGLFYSFATTSAAIDEDCIGEHFINNPDGGGVAYCGYSRLEYIYSGNPPQGPGPALDVEFFRLLFDYSAYHVGRTLADSRTPFIPWAQQSENDYRWALFGLLLLGDPTLELWTDTPVQISAAHDSTVSQGSISFQVNVNEDSALVSCVKDGNILGTAYSAAGVATVWFESSVDSIGIMYVTVTKHNRIPYLDSVSVTPVQGPYVRYRSHEIDDSSGNNNGVVNPGETILVRIGVENAGTETAYGVSAVLRESDEHVLVSDSVSSFGDIDPGATAQNLEDYVVEVDASCPDSHTVEFRLETTDGETIWLSTFWVMAVKPDFILTLSMDTALVYLGDSAAIQVNVASVGGFNLPVNLTHSELPPNVSGIFYPSQLTPTDSSIFRAYAALDVNPVICSIAVTSAGGDITHEKELMLKITPPPYFGPLWHVSTSGDDLVGNGSEEFPFRTIQQGIDTATDGDSVVVEPGRYVENIYFAGKAILLASRFIFDELEATIESTIIDGNREWNVVDFHSGEDSASVITGFTITGGYGYDAGGISCWGSSPVIADNFILDNQCWVGVSAGGVSGRSGSSPRLERNLISNCTGRAAVLFESYCDPKLINNTICDNSDGGLYLEMESGAYLKNNVICNNGEYGILVEWGSADVLYNDVYGHDHNYWGDIGDQTGINGNISADPLFVNGSGGDYHLIPGSPCIDAGDPADSVPPGGGDRIDMGAFERQVGPDFFMSTVPDTAVINPGDSASIKLVVTSFYGFNELVQLSHSGLPPEVTGYLYPDSLVPTDSSVFRIYSTTGANPGGYTIIITASSVEITHEKEIILGIPPPAYDGPVWHVSETGNDLFGNGSEQVPFRTIQKGIDAASGGDTVLVERGVYVENIDFAGKAILVASHFVFDGLESAIESTIIDGNGSGHVVSFVAGEDFNSVIRGFTITGGRAELGGGIYCYRSSPSIVENILVGNTCIGKQGGPAIWDEGGAGPRIYRNLIVANSGPAAIGLEQDTNAQVVGNTICKNSHGAIFLDLVSQALLKNNILYSNGDYGIFKVYGSVDFLYNDVYGHDDNYVPSPWDQTGINGNIAVNPLFRDISAGDYRLSAASPCIDAGDPSDSVPPGGGDRIDMGAREYPYEFVRGDANGDGQINLADIAYLIDFLFRASMEPYPLQAGDTNGDGEVNVADVVYLVNYLFRDGPPPGQEGGKKMARSPVTGLWLSKRTVADGEAIEQVVVRGRIEVDVAGVQLAIAFDPKEASPKPILPAHVSDMKIYSSQKDGLLKVGVVDLRGESFIPAGGKVDLLVLEVNGAGLSNPSIVKAVLSDRNGQVLPVKMLTEDEREELHPQSFRLFQNYPNPFNPQTQISYALPQTCDVRVTVYNLLGQRVRVLVDGHQQAGCITVHWDGKDEQGTDVASGIYFYKIEAGDFVDAKKMLLLK